MCPISFGPHCRDCETNSACTNTTINQNYKQLKALNRAKRFYIEIFSFSAIVSLLILFGIACLNRF
jgi:hypothetical protein